MARIKYYNPLTKDWEYADEGYGLALDTTLSKPGQAADASAVGIALAEKQPKGDYALKSEIPTNASDLNAVVPPELPTETAKDVQSVLNALAVKPSGIQSDWNQNDETQLDYVKNRIAYKSGKKVLVYDIAKSDVNFVPQGQSPGVFKASIEPFPLIEEEEYTVDWEGATYTLTAHSEPIYSGEVIIGNITIFGPPQPDTGEPFLYAAGFGLLTKQSGAVHNISICHYADEIVYLPDEFISPEFKRLVNQKTGKANLANGEIYNDYANNEAGPYAHAEGFKTKATGNISHTEGSGTTASGNNSHAEGSGTTASGYSSHAEGDSTTASGYSSHAEGDSTTASGYSSHAEGDSTTASSTCQHTQGRYNIDDPANKYAHIVGNGTYSIHSNAHTLDWEGNSWYQSSVLVAGTDMDAPDAELNPDSVIIKSSTPGSVKRFKITVTDDGAIKATEVVASTV